jgi:hypothetical protein
LKLEVRYRLSWNAWLRVECLALDEQEAVDDLLFPLIVSAAAVAVAVAASVVVVAAVVAVAVEAAAASAVLAVVIAVASGEVVAASDFGL